MRLCRQPASVACRHLDVALGIAAMQPTLEGGERAHEAVRVRVRRGAVYRIVSIIQDPYAVVHEQNRVRLGVAHYRIVGHAGEYSRSTRTWQRLRGLVPGQSESVRRRATVSTLDPFPSEDRDVF